MCESSRSFHEQLQRHGEGRLVATSDVGRGGSCASAADGAPTRARSAICGCSTWTKLDAVGRLVVSNGCGLAALG